MPWDSNSTLDHEVVHLRAKSKVEFAVSNYLRLSWALASDVDGIISHELAGMSLQTTGRVRIRLIALIESPEELILFLHLTKYFETRLIVIAEPKDNTLLKASR